MYTEITHSTSPRIMPGYGITISAPEIMVSGPSGSLKISLQDIGRVLWKMHLNREGFLLRYGMNVKYSIGDGYGRAIIVNEGDRFKDVDQVIYCSFSPMESVPTNADDWIFEDDLIVERLKSSIKEENLGKHKFCVRSFRIDGKCDLDILKFINEKYLPWEKYVERLAMPRSTISELIEREIDMAVKCLECGNERIIVSKKLQNHLVLGLSIEDFEKKLICSRCRARYFTLTLY